MKKRILALFLACMMVVSVIAVPAFAEEECTHKNKTYTSLETGKNVPKVCTDGAVVCAWDCDDCDATGYEKVTGEHVLATGWVDATCTSPAMAGQYCALCGEKGAMTPVDGSVALGHDWKINTENDDYKAPTCDDAGKGSFYCTRCDATKPAEDILPVEHSWDMVGVVTATCAHGAGIQYKCLLCGDTKVVEFTDGELVDPAKGHTPGTATDKAATCAEEGYTGRVLCTVCNEVIDAGTKVEKNPATHTEKLVETLKAATCTATGVGKYECKDCKADLGYKAIPAGHTYDKGTVTKVPTCGEAGTIKFSCTVCKKAEVAYTETISATGEHTIVTGVIAATCTTPEKAGQYCSVCGYEKNMTVVPNGVDALNHNYVNKIDCTLDKDGKVGGKVPALPTCSAEGWGYRACSRCGVLEPNGGSKTAPIVLAKLPHTFGKGVHADATCTTPAGVKETCSVCNYAKVTAYTGDLAVDALGHNMVADTAADRTATCYQTGITGSQKCNRTGCTYKVTGTTVAKDANNHGAKLVIDYLKKPTCTETGVAVYTCSNCPNYIEYKSAPAAHTWDAGTVTTAATCGAKGVKTYKCTVDGCKGVKTADIAATGNHTITKNVTLNATCVLNERVAKEYCAVCGYTKDVTDVKDGQKALGHNYVNKIDCTLDKDGKVGGKVPAMPTCTAEGWGYIACSRCGELKSGSKTAPVVLAKVAHTLGAGVHADATCTDPAGVRKDCANCNYYEVEPYTTDGLKQDKLGHTEVAVADKAATCASTGFTGRTKCKVCGIIVKAGTTLEKDKNNHEYVLVSTLKAPTCTTVGVGQYSCKNTECDVTYFGSIAAGHIWNEEEILVSESGNALYNPCTVCDAVKVMTDLADDGVDSVGKTLDSLVLGANVQITGVVNKNVALAIQVSNIAGYTGLWIEVNGVKVAESTVNGGVYTFVYKTSVSNIADTFNVIVKGEKYGVVCTSEVTAYNFALLEDELVVDALATTKIENATASFKGRGVLIGETVKLMYIVDASEASSVVLKKYGSDTVFAKIDLADLVAVDGVYVVEIEINADDWNQVFAASIVDAEGNVISNTNYYSVAQYAANNIKGTDKLSNVLSAMMQAVAE